jgi:hypothetical protein
MAVLVRKNQAPVCTVAPTLWAQGTANPTTVQQNRPVFCTFGTWTVDSDRWYMRQWRWLVNGVEVSGDEGNMPFYDVAGTIGDTIACRMDVVNDTGQTTSITTASATVIADARTVRTSASLGYKTSKTTGSISAGSNVLTVASVTGFSVNDWVIVSVGGEAGLGLRGTEGVGGAWPPLAYANAAAMNADTSKATGTFAWLRDTGDVYIWSGSAWAQDTRYYYYLKVVPRALVAKITAIDVGAKTFTLNYNATVAATNADVYFDNTRPHFAIYTGSSWDQNLIEFPAGIFAFSDCLPEVVSGFVTTVATGRTIKGAGDTTIFKSPPGVGARWGFGSSSDCHYRDLKIVGSVASPTSFCFNSYKMVNNVAAAAFPSPVGDGLYMATCTYSTSRNVTFEGCFRSFLVGSGSYNFAADCDISSVGLEGYVQWQYQWADTSFGGAWRCSVDCGVIEPCFEPFRSTSIYFKDCVGVNAQAALNTCGDVVFDNFQVTWEEGAGVTPSGINKYLLVGDWLLNINANIDPSSALPRIPSWIRNLTFVQTGTPYGPSDMTPGQAIPISPTFERTSNGLPSVLISGGYPNVPNGLIQAPRDVGRVAIDSAANVAIRGMRVDFADPSGASSVITLNSSSNGLGMVRQCVVDSVSANGSAEVANITNAEYEAL